MVQVSQLGGPQQVSVVEDQLIKALITILDYEQVEFSEEA